MFKEKLIVNFVNYVNSRICALLKFIQKQNGSNERFFYTTKVAYYIGNVFALLFFVIK